MREVTLNATGAYLNGATYDLSISISRPSRAGTTTGASRRKPTDWTITAAGFTGDGFRLPTPADGARFQVAFRIRTVTP